MIEMKFMCYESIDEIMGEVHNGPSDRVSPECNPRFILKRHSFASVSELLQHAKETNPGDYDTDEKRNVIFNGGAKSVSPTPRRPRNRRRKHTPLHIQLRGSGLVHDKRTTEFRHRSSDSSVPEVPGTMNTGANMEAGQRFLDKLFGTQSEAVAEDKRLAIEKARRDYAEAKKRDDMNDRIKQRIAEREAKAVADEAKAVTDEAEAVTDEAKAVTDEAEAVADFATESADSIVAALSGQPDPHKPVIADKAGPGTIYLKIADVTVAQSDEICRFARVNWDLECRTISLKGGSLSSGGESTTASVLVPSNIDRDQTRAIKSKIARVINRDRKAEKKAAKLGY